MIICSFNIYIYIYIYCQKESNDGDFVINIIKHVKRLILTCMNVITAVKEGIHRL